MNIIKAINSLEEDYKIDVRGIVELRIISPYELLIKANNVEFPNKSKVGRNGATIVIHRGVNTHILNCVKSFTLQRERDNHFLSHDLDMMYSAVFYSYSHDIKIELINKLTLEDIKTMQNLFNARMDIKPFIFTQEYE